MWRLSPSRSEIRPKHRRVAAALAAADYDLAVDPDAVVGTLSVGEQQRVEILKTLHRGAEIFVLDERGYCDVAPGTVVPPELQARARRGAQACPEGAIDVIDVIDAGTP